MDYDRRVFALTELTSFHESEIKSHKSSIELLKAELRSICTHPEDKATYFTEFPAGFIIDFKACNICGLTKQVREK